MRTVAGGGEGGDDDEESSLFFSIEGEDGMIPLLPVEPITSLIGEISGFSTDDFTGDCFINFFRCRCSLLFLARNQESNAINTSKNPTSTRMQPAKNRDLNKRKAATIEN